MTDVHESTLQEQRAIFAQRFPNRTHPHDCTGLEGGWAPHIHGACDCVGSRLTDSSEQRFITMIDRRIAAYEKQDDDAGHLCRLALIYLRCEITGEKHAHD